MKLLETDRLRLEPQVVAHADQMFPVLCDPALYTYEDEPPPSVEWLRARFLRLERRSNAEGTERWLNWVLRDKADAALIGYVQATLSTDGQAAIAYILHGSRWGQGLASEAVTRMLQELADGYRIRTFFAVVKRANHRSLRLLERLGFAEELPPLRRVYQIGPDEVVWRRPAGPVDAGLRGRARGSGRPASRR